MFENLHGFHSYKFYNDKWRNTILCKDVALSLGQLNFYWSSKCNCNSLLYNFPMKAKRFEIIFRNLLKSIEKADSQIISWRNSKLKSTRGTTLFKCPSHSNCRNIQPTLSFSALFDRFNTILNKIFVDFFTF